MFYIQTDNGEGDIYALDATVNFSRQFRSSITSYAVESGSKVSDHYDKDQQTLSYSGIISDAKFAKNSSNLSADDYERAMIELRDSGQLFACSFSNNLEVVLNCLFESLSFSTNPDIGYGSREVQFSIKQIEKANRAVNTVSPVPADKYKDQLPGKSKGSGSTKEAPVSLADQSKRLRTGDPNARVEGLFD
jgi:hypothetical protein